MILFLILGFCVLLVLGIPVAYSMGISATFVIMMDPKLLNTIMAQKIYTSLDSFSFIAIPLFMIAGALMNATGITKKLIHASRSIVGHFSGGLAQSTVVTGMLMAGVSGSSVADSSAIATVMVPSLEKEGYDRGFACALVSSAGSLGPIIPPSIIMIVYSGVVSISVGKLFVAGIVPGVLLGFAMIGYSYFYARRHKIPKTEFAGVKTAAVSVLGSLGALIMPLIIIGGIVTGIVTATESGILAIIYGIVYGFITRSINLGKIRDCIFEAVKSAVQPMIIIAFASLFGYVLTYYGLAKVINSFMMSFSLTGPAVLIIIFLIIYIAGMFIESTAILLVLVPVFAPLVPVYGFDPLHFAMVCIVSLVLGGISPPVGIVMYVVSGVTGTDLKRIIKSVWPFVFIFSIGVMLIIFFPKIVLFLPGLLY